MARGRWARCERQAWIACTLLTLFRSVTQRSDERRNTPWKKLIQSVYRTLMGSDQSTLAGLRRYPIPL
jgi:hypothetical protein